MKKPRELPQIRIIHLSDIHFGSKHNCVHPDSTCSSAGIPLLADLIENDLQEPIWAYSLWATSKDDNISNPVIIASTGDFTECADNDSFNKSLDLLSRLSSRPLLDKNISLKNVFMVPGNHDVDYTKSKPEERFQQYCIFYNRLYTNERAFIQPHQFQSLSQVHVRPEIKLVVVEINSCQYVEKESVDESRGQVDLATIAKLRKDLEAVRLETQNFIKVALIHHHPILIPTLVEHNRGYDAVFK